mmetsp:Transcript_12708/g.19993  ORF Transcript_12708/g.19993 Transcript_12708/m.19993 type:complete len:403 (+) Transcript_12708:2-1210(+)
MMRVKNELQINVKMDPSLLVKKYEQEIKELKQELAMHDALSGRNRVQYDPYSEEQRYNLAQTIRSYLKGEVEDLEVLNVRHVKEIFVQFKIIANNAIDEAANMRPSTGNQQGEGGDEAGDGDGAKGDGVGELADTRGFSVGRAPDAAKPLHSVKSGPESPQRDPNASEAGSPKKPVKRIEKGEPVPDKNQAFEEFKETDGKTLNTELRENALELKAKKQQQKDLAVRINTLKKEIDSLKVQLETRREAAAGSAEKSGGEIVVDEEEYALVRTLKSKKQEYRESYEELKMYKSEVEYLNKRTEQARAKLVVEFETWYKASYEDEDVTMVGMGDVSTVLDEQEDGEVMDDGEKFDRLEVERVMSEDPESLAYHKAAKNVFRKTQVGAKGKTKRVKGDAAPQPII